MVYLQAIAAVLGALIFIMPILFPDSKINGEWK